MSVCCFIPAPLLAPLVYPLIFYHVHGCVLFFFPLDHQVFIYVNNCRPVPAGVRTTVRLRPPQHAIRPETPRIPLNSTPSSPLLPRALTGTPNRNIKRTPLLPPKNACLLAAVYHISSPVRVACLCRGLVQLLDCCLSLFFFPPSFCLTQGCAIPFTQTPAAPRAPAQRRPPPHPPVLCSAKAAAHLLRSDQWLSSPPTQDPRSGRPRARWSRPSKEEEEAQAPSLRDGGGASARHSSG